MRRIIKRLRIIKTWFWILRHVHISRIGLHDPLGGQPFWGRSPGEWWDNGLRLNRLDSEIWEPWIRWCHPKMRFVIMGIWNLLDIHLLGGLEMFEFMTKLEPRDVFEIFGPTVLVERTRILTVNLPVGPLFHQSLKTEQQISCLVFLKFTILLAVYHGVLRNVLKRILQDAMQLKRLLYRGRVAVPKKFARCLFVLVSGSTLKWSEQKRVEMDRFGSSQHLAQRLERGESANPKER